MTFKMKDILGASCKFVEKQLRDPNSPTLAQQREASKRDYVHCSMSSDCCTIIRGLFEEIARRLNKLLQENPT